MIPLRLNFYKDILSTEVISSIRFEVERQADVAMVGHLILVAINDPDHPWYKKSTLLEEGAEALL